MNWKITFEIIGALGGITTVLALLLGPMFYVGGKIDGIRQNMESLRKEMYEENKEFHGRLVSLEERIRKDKNG
jgi:glucose-6-phosphate-specific signal transduction histidine kinase